ncbi:MAG: PAS domain-containing protein [Spirochaetaceae bacterium]
MQVPFIPRIPGSLTDLFNRSRRRGIAEFMARTGSDVFFRYRVHPTERVEFANEAVERVLGYPVSDWYTVPRLLGRLVHPEDYVILEGLKRGVIPSGPTVVRWTARDGRIVWVEERFRGVWNRRGTLICIDAIGRDVSERVIAEQRYHDLVERNNRVLRRVHQRVGESLQLLSAIVRLREDNPSPAQQTRMHVHVRALALVSNAFEHADTPISVSMSKYVRGVVHVASEYLKSGTPPHISTDVQPMELRVDQASACGLLLVEFLADLMQAYEGSSYAPVLRVSLTRLDRADVELSVFVRAGDAHERQPRRPQTDPALERLLTVLTTTLRGEYSVGLNPAGHTLRFEMAKMQ